MKRNLVFAVIGILFVFSMLAYGQSEVSARVVHSATVVKETMDIPEKGIPKDLLSKCTCVAVIPSMKKGAIGIGAAYGKGVISCRTDSGTGPWSAPAMISLRGGSFGFQLGGEAVDLVLVVMNLSGLESLLDNKFTLGADASVAAGPVGRTSSAETDAWMSAKILAYSRSRGLFGGLALKGNAIRPDKDANHILYGKDISARDLLLKQGQSIPKEAKIFVDELTRISPQKAP